MKLVEMLEKIPDTEIVKVKDFFDPKKELSRYDGKDSINPYFNNCEVERVYKDGNWLAIEIGLESLV